MIYSPTPIYILVDFQNRPRLSSMAQTLASFACSRENVNDERVQNSNTKRRQHSLQS